MERLIFGKISLTEAVLSVVYAINLFVIVVNFAIEPGQFFGRSKLVFGIAKTLILPICTAIYVISTRTISVFVLAQQILACIGDFAFLFDTWYCTYIGGFTFGFSHLVLPISYGLKWLEIPHWVYLIMVITVTGHLMIVVPKQNYKTVKSYCTTAYVVALELGLFFALARITVLPVTSIHYLASVLGYCFFIFSDNIVIHVESVDKNHGRRIEIMSTYAIAQFLLMIGNVTK